MLIDSGFQGFGFFGQICGWMLDLLPFVDEQGWHRAHWRMLSKLYGDPPHYDLFKSVLQLAYEPEDDPPGVTMFEDLHWRFTALAGTSMVTTCGRTRFGMRTFGGRRG